MCLLIALYQAHPDAPLIVAANRDEALSRPAVPMTILRAEGPRVLGGRDELAGGTWLAIGEHGVIAGVTNRPAERSDPGKRSRGEWPLFLAQHSDAASAVEAFLEEFDPADFNPGWLLVGDRRNLYYLDVTWTSGSRAVQLEPGVHVLENVPLEAPSPKADLIRAQLQDVGQVRGVALRRRLGEILRSHELPTLPDAASGDSPPRLPERLAACVHTEKYGTRSSTIVSIPDAPQSPAVWYSDGPPCQSELVTAAELWRAPAEVQDDLGKDHLAGAP